MTTPVYQLILNELQGAVRLLIRGAAHELTEHHDVSQPGADILTLTAVICEVDALADLPTLTLSEVTNAIRVSIENEHADALANAEESKTSALIDTTIDGHVGYLMMVKEFKEACNQGMFNDHDGMGDLVKEDKIVTKRGETGIPEWIYPSNLENIPEDITHILWYNK